MKLFCIEATVVKGGKIVEKGQHYDTGDVPKKEDREAYELISAGRMVVATETETVARVKDEIKTAAEVKAQEKADRAAAKKAGKE